MDVSQKLTEVLQNIKEHSKLNAFVQVYETEAKERAKEIDERIKQKQAGKLNGLIVGLKDLISYEDHPLQAASKILEGFIAKYNATVVERLLVEDAIIIGHQNCDEFGMGSSNEYSIYGKVYNALDNTKVPGGSSGGSAVAVQTNMCDIALATDTGGSVRQPASFCGIVGLKPTYSRISRYGVVAHASSFDTVGILSRNIKDNAKVLSVIAGKDDSDNTVSHTPVEDYLSEIPYKRKAKIAYLKEIIDCKDINPSIQKNTHQVIRSLKEKGHSLHPIPFEYLNVLLPTYYFITTAEASSNLAKYDGIRYGYRNKTASEENFKKVYSKTRTEGLGKEVKKRILLGNLTLSSEHYSSFFTKAQKVRRLIRNTMKTILSQYDFIVLPTTATTAFSLENYKNNTTSMYLSDMYTVLASLAGMPAISLPSGLDKKGMPTGVQIIADDFQETKLLGISDQIFHAL